MIRICLDTSAYSHFKRGDPEVVEVVMSAHEVNVPVIVLGELRAGFRRGNRAGQNERDLQEFFANSVVRVLDVDEEASSIYADLVVDLQRAGTPLPTNDIWIAAIAVREGATVITYDDHFQAIQRVMARIMKQQHQSAT